MAEEAAVKDYPEKVQKVLELLKSFTLMELKDLKDAYEETFGVQAASMAMAAMPMAGMAGAGGQPGQGGAEIIGDGGRRRGELFSPLGGPGLYQKVSTMRVHTDLSRATHRVTPTDRMDKGDGTAFDTAPGRE